MVQIYTNFNINRQSYFPISRPASYLTTPLKKDEFQSTKKEISFKGVEGLFKKAPNLFPKIEILPGVSDDFVTKITRQISEFSPEWLKEFKNNNYKIILSPTFSDAYKSQKVFDSAIERVEKQNPKGTLGVTYSEGKFGKNFFVFCDKPPYSNIFMRNITNHELSHGVVNIKELDKNNQTLKAIKKDVELIIKERKLDKLTAAERQMISYYFFNPYAHLPIDEIIADVYAWNQGGGCYGSGLVMNVKNPDLMKNIFSNLSEYLKTV